tara:strand:+ start:1741 stop:3012 length:1272 start_codon:yes stop_codon:yes gene_type:complete
MALKTVPFLTGYVSPINSIQSGSPLYMKFIILFFLGSLTVAAVAETTFESWSYMENDLYPSAIISTATVDWNGDKELAEDKNNLRKKIPKDQVALFGDENGWLGVDLTNLPKGATIEVEISIDGFLRPSKWKGKTKRAYADARIFPKASWDYDALHKVRQQRPATATFKVSVNGQALSELSDTFIIHSINDCPFYVAWDEKGQDVDDFSWLFAAYVNENHPLVDDILKEALETDLVDEFSGYQEGDPDHVLEQVFAIWHVLQRRGIKYSDISTTTPGEYVTSQSVRFIDDTIEATQANCVDGSVLMASILQKIGINSYLAMVPGHCFLAFDDGDHARAEVLGLETTKLGNADLKPATKAGKLPATISKKEFKSSFRTFSNAIEEGNDQLDRYWKKFTRGNNPDIQLISIIEAREFGIMPIATD